MIKFRNNNKHFFMTKYKSVICIEDITHVVKVTNEWDGHTYWAGYYAYIRNSKGDNFFKDPTRLRLEEDDYKKLRKYLPIINNI